jgi:hypothetical protein
VDSQPKIGIPLRGGIETKVLTTENADMLTSLVLKNMQVEIQRTSISYPSKEYNFV